jgi:hypothetical protein
MARCLVFGLLLFGRGIGPLVAFAKHPRHLHDLSQRDKSAQVQVSEAKVGKFRARLPRALYGVGVWGAHCAAVLDPSPAELPRNFDEHFATLE